ncbi:cell division protein PerM [Aestuariimicrobium soli]|uniref:cell division protein PerM n=1 Tax=Aestuariimicrobium soli TaxID=2035834 RepID=UPI003EBA24FD
MASSDNRRRSRKQRGFDVEVADAPQGAERPRLTVWWPLAAVGAGLLSALSLWVVVTGVVLVGWTAAPDIGLGSVLTVATRFWLLGYFAPASVGDVELSLTPLGLTALGALVVSWLSGWAAAQARRGDGETLSQRQRGRLVARSAALFTLAHVVLVMVAAGLVSSGQQPARALIGSVLVMGAASLVGGARACEWHPLLDLPLWARAVPRAVGVAVLTMTACGAAALFVQLLRRRDQVEALHRALEAGTVGGILLLVLQLLWLPNLVIWMASWALGAGFTLGDGSVVSPAANQTGMLPGIPVLGAVPAAGPGPAQSWWWLLSGVLAGALAALVILRARPRARFDETALVGGLAGVVAGGVMVALGWLAGGDLGSNRLAGLGPRITQLFVMSPTLMGLAGVLTGFAVGLLRRPDDSLTDGIEVERA